MDIECLVWYHSNPSDFALQSFVYFCGSYDDETDQVMSYQRIPLKDLDKIEIGSFFCVLYSVLISIE